MRFRPPLIFFFTGGAGAQHGYRDKWEGNVFHYTGEGQVGDMKLDRGNRAMRDHASLNKDLLGFEETPRSGIYRYLGRFECETWSYSGQPDREGTARQAIVFQLRPAGSFDIDEASTLSNSGLPLDELRAAAVAAAQSQPPQATKQGTRTIYERSLDVVAYVLARAAGTCEACKKAAPFLRQSNNTPYLECHHTRRLSDGGLDHPDFVGAICPTCHRQIHHAADGLMVNDQLKKHIAEREAELAGSSSTFAASRERLARTK